MGDATNHLAREKCGDDNDDDDGDDEDDDDHDRKA